MGQFGSSNGTEKVMDKEIQDLKRRAGIIEQNDLPAGFGERNIVDNLRQAEEILVKVASVREPDPSLVKAHSLVHGARRMAEQMVGKTTEPEEPKYEPRRAVLRPPPRRRPR